MKKVVDLQQMLNQNKGMIGMGTIAKASLGHGVLLRTSAVVLVVLLPCAVGAG